MPDEDFVKMAPVYAAAGVAATASSDTEEVNAGENDDALSDDDIFLEDDENEDSDNELQEDDEDVDIDDEDNDKLDLIMKIIGIGIAVIILIVTIFVIVKLVEALSHIRMKIQKLYQLQKRLYQQQMPRIQLQFLRLRA